MKHFDDFVLRRREANAAFNDAAAAVEALCRDVGVHYTYKDEFIAARNALAEREGRPPASLGSTELGRITTASNGLVHGTTLQIPTTGYHTMEETARIESVEAFMRVPEAMSRGGQVPLSNGVA